MTDCRKEVYKANQQIQAKIIEYGWPELNAIPNPAYLVVGSTPFEKRKGRTFYDDTAYYQLDIQKVLDTAPATAPAPTRYFAIKLIDKSRLLGDVYSEKPKTEVEFIRIKAMQFITWYCNSFDTIIFDNSVIKMFDSYNRDNAIEDVIEHLLLVLKPGGQLIIDSIEPGLFAVGSMLSKEQQVADRAAQKKNFLNQLILKKNHSKRDHSKRDYSIKTYSELIAENPVAAAVYGPLIGAAGAAAGAGGADWEVKGTHEAIVFTKPAAAGGGKRRRSSTKKRRGNRRKSHSTRIKYSS